MLTTTSGLPLTIEDALVADAVELLALQKLAYQSEAELYADYGIPPLTQTVEEMEAEFGDHVVLKAAANRQIIGSVRARTESGTCHVGRLIVHPRFQNRGIGTRLMAAIEERFPHAQRFELFTGHRSIRNLHLYRKLGYRPFRRQPLSDQVELVFLEKQNQGPGSTSQ